MNSSRETRCRDLRQKTSGGSSSGDTLSSEQSYDYHPRLQDWHRLGIRPGHGTPRSHLGSVHEDWEDVDLNPGRVTEKWSRDFRGPYETNLRRTDLRPVTSTNQTPCINWKGPPKGQPSYLSFISSTTGDRSRTDGIWPTMSSPSSLRKPVYTRPETVHSSTPSLQDIYLSISTLENPNRKKWVLRDLSVGLTMKIITKQGKKKEKPLFQRQWDLMSPH